MVESHSAMSKKFDNHMVTRRVDPTDQTLHDQQKMFFAFEEGLDDEALSKELKVHKVAWRADFIDHTLHNQQKM
eukprot:9985319-Karenia_brevis.AAC.1